jgi:hypothetical protein
MDEVKESSVDDLSEFADYIAEFDVLMSFDNEDCPVCGVSIPEKVLDQRSPFIVFKSFNSLNAYASLINYLKEKSIPYKIEKRINQEVIEEIEYIYDVKVPFKCKIELDKQSFF